MNLVTHHLVFTATALTPVVLGPQSGSAVRGAIAGALWGRFCVNKTAPACTTCPLLAMCPVGALLSPMRDEEQKGSDQHPRPYVTRPPRHSTGVYAPGDTIEFGVALFGSAATFYPYIVMAVHELERIGLGMRQSERGGRRGLLRLSAITAENPLTGVRQTLYTAEGGAIREPALPIGPTEVRSYAATLPEDRLTLQFETPLRLIEQGRLLKRIALRPLIQRLMRRLDDLCNAYGDGSLNLDFRGLLALADEVQVVEDHTRWIDVVSVSHRHSRRTPIGGLIGRVTFAGALGPLRELIVWGSLIHVGRNCVKGDGWYRILSE